MSASRVKVFAQPCRTTEGHTSAIWRGDRITPLRRSGRRVLCRIQWGNTVGGAPHEMTAWLRKSWLRLTEGRAA